MQRLRPVGASVLLAVHRQHDDFGEAVPLAVHRVQVLLDLWHLRQRRPVAVLRRLRPGVSHVLPVAGTHLAARGLLELQAVRGRVPHTEAETGAQCVAHTTVSSDATATATTGSATRGHARLSSRHAPTNDGTTFRISSTGTCTTPWCTHDASSTGWWPTTTDHARESRQQPPVIGIQTLKDPIMRSPTRKRCGITSNVG